MHFFDSRHSEDSTLSMCQHFFIFTEFSFQIPNSLPLYFTYVLCFLGHHSAIYWSLFLSSQSCLLLFNPLDPLMKWVLFQVLGSSRWFQLFLWCALGRWAAFVVSDVRLSEYRDCALGLGCGSGNHSEICNPSETNGVFYGSYTLRHKCIKSMDFRNLWEKYPLWNWN